MYSAVTVTVLVVVVVVVLIGLQYLLHPEEGHSREQRVRAGLMLSPNPLQLQLVRHFLESPLPQETPPVNHSVLHNDDGDGPRLVPSSGRYLEVLAALHEVLDVVDGREEEVEDLEEVVLLLRQPGVRQQLHQVAEVVAADTTGEVTR